jgi:SMI1 / KNR4 family (SUKH-1)
MSSFDWERFLTRWSQEIIDSIGNDQQDLPPAVRKSGWLGYPGATKQQIAHAEARLGITLPPSYKAFLKVTNGWRQTSPFSNQLWSVQDIAWFATRHQAWINAYIKKADHRSADSTNAKAPTPSIPDAEYFIYGDDQDCSKIRVEYLQTALEISKRGDGAIFLLNPQIVTPEGEWEAWFFGDWLPGADRYRSFQEMMQTEYESFLELRDAPTAAIAPGSQGEPAQAEPLKPDNDAVIERSLNGELASFSATISSDSDRALPSEFEPPTDEWRDLASFTIECQTRQQPDDQRTLIRHEETGAVEIQPDLDTEAMQQWLHHQINQGNDQPLQAQKPVGVEITQLRVIRSPHAEIWMVADRAQPLFSETISRGEPFVLEVSLHMLDSVKERLAEQQLVYRAQCIAHHLSTRLDTALGDLTTHISGGHQSTYTAQFPEARLQQPGLYRLKVWVTLQNIAVAPGYFKVPVLQVT